MYRNFWKPTFWAIFSEPVLWFLMTAVALSYIAAASCGCASIQKAQPQIAEYVQCQTVELDEVVSAIKSGGNFWLATVLSLTQCIPQAIAVINAALAVADRGYASSTNINAAFVHSSVRLRYRVVIADRIYRVVSK